MPDEIIKELWEIKDAIAREHGYDLDALVRYLRGQEGARGGQVVDLSKAKRSEGQLVPKDAAGHRR